MHCLVALPRWGCKALGRSSVALRFDSHYNLGPQ